MKHAISRSNLIIGLIFAVTLGSVGWTFISFLQAGSGANTTGANTTGGSEKAGAKADFEEGMKALKGQNVTAAISHFNTATDSLANTTEDSSSVIESIKQGVKLLESGAIGNATSVLGNASKLLK